MPAACSPIVEQEISSGFKIFSLRKSASSILPLCSFGKRPIIKSSASSETISEDALIMRISLLECPLHDQISITFYEPCSLNRIFP